MSFVCRSQETEPIFSQELSSTNVQLLSVRNLHRYLFQNDAWLVIRTKMTELSTDLEVLFNFVDLTLEFCLFCRVLSFRSFTR